MSERERDEDVVGGWVDGETNAVDRDGCTRGSIDILHENE